MRNQHKAAQQKIHAGVLASHCDVCFVPFSKLPPKKIEEGLDILYCAKCTAKTHKCCYNFEANLTVINDRLSEFLCDRCAKETLRAKGCLVCQGADGLLKEVPNNELIHVYCGMVHNEVDVLSYYPAISFKKTACYEDAPSLCEICHLKNAHDFCAEDSCRKRVHAYCARKIFARLEGESDEPPRSWNHHMSVGNSGSLDLAEEPIPYEVFS